MRLLMRIHLTRRRAASAKGKPTLKAGNLDGDADDAVFSTTALDCASASRASRLLFSSRAAVCSPAAVDGDDYDFM